MMKPSNILLWFRQRRNASGKKPGEKRKAHGSVQPASLDWQKTALVVVTIALLSVLMSVHLMPDKLSLRLGDTSPQTIHASRSVTYVNTVLTDQAQQAARLATRPVYETDDTALPNANRSVQELFDRIESERDKIHPPHLPGIKPQTLTQSVSALEAEFGPALSQGQYRSLLTLSIPAFQKLRDTTASLVSETMEREIRDQSDPNVPSADLSHARMELTDAAREALSSEENALLVRAIAERALRPNRLLDRHKTELAQDAAARAVRPVYGRIAQGEEIIAAGKRVTQEHLDKFVALGLLDPRLDFQTGAAICILAAAMVLLVAFAIKRALPKLYADRRRLALLSCIVLISVLGLKVGATMLGLQFTGGQLGYLGMMSVAAAGMLVSVLIDTHLAVLVVALLAVQSGLIMNHEIRFTVMTLMSSLVGIGSVRNARSKNNLLSTAIALSVANVVLVWLLGLLLADSLPELITGTGWAIGSALFATFLFWLGVLALEKPFGILTHTALLEMSASDRPLLQQLCAVAPGTYAHSMMVGTLAEAGARAIGADALLCRVGGYYHDIGKMRRPEFFVENQRQGNVHGRLSPSVSALFITAHVRDGLEMAQEKRLPKEIQDIIAQHHGTTLIRYFYHQALTDCGGSDEAPPGLEDRFRYPGPKPQTREAAIVMLADSVEAAARCLLHPTRERLETDVAKIVHDKVEDGQFDECDLTFKDIKGIGDAFVHILSAMMHERIEYPQPPVRTGSGQPMEVSRPDLKPIAPPLPLPIESASENFLRLAAGMGEDRETDHILAVHLATKDSLGAVGGLGPSTEVEGGETAASNAPAEALRTARPLPSLEPEVRYAGFPAERPPLPDPDDRTPQGSKSPAQIGRTDPGRGQHPANG
ncbi:MAG TPA: HDIG domain-containing protein [Chthonomonadaceae bacterium]|nr:HDIG domain-containing protein [Chthonomonadaceae bacterium]